MNIHTREADNISLQDKADAALDVLRVWSRSASQDELAAMAKRLAPLAAPAGYPDLSQDYPEEFVADPDYKSWPARFAEWSQFANPWRTAGDPACGDLEFSAADPVSHSRRWRRQARDLSHWYRKLGGWQKGH
jgi:hypothetical protein